MHITIILRWFSVISTHRLEIIPSVIQCTCHVIYFIPSIIICNIHLSFIIHYCMCHASSCKSVLNINFLSNLHYVSTLEVALQKQLSRSSSLEVAVALQKQLQLSRSSCSSIEVALQKQLSRSSSLEVALQKQLSRSSCSSLEVAVALQKQLSRKKQLYRSSSLEVALQKQLQLSKGSSLSSLQLTHHRQGTLSVTYRWYLYSDKPKKSKGICYISGLSAVLHLCLLV